MLLVYRVKSAGILIGFAASLLAYFAISPAAHPGWWPHLYSTSSRSGTWTASTPPFPSRFLRQGVRETAVFALVQ